MLVGTHTRSLPKKTVLFIALGILLAIGAIDTAAAEWPTEGGGEGRVIEVTTLADGGPGSLRVALASGGRRVIEFSVSGEIFLRSPLLIRNPFVTVAGETAPSPGITLIGEKLRIRAHDVIVRDIRVRVGELPGGDPANRDGISIDRSGNYPVGNILIDHCSIAWSVDEGLAIWGKGISNVLVRRTIIAEALNESVHPKGEHSMGLITGPGTQNIVIERNLFADNKFRNPLVDAGAAAVVVNNLIYNPGWNGFHVYGKPKEGPTLVSVVGNLLIAGRDTRDHLLSFHQGVNEGSEIYYHDNVAVGTAAFMPDEKAGKSGSLTPVPFVDTPPLWFDWIDVLPTDRVEENVLSDVGARPNDRDETDRRIVREVRDRSGSIKNTPPDERLSVGRPLPAE
jgi:pectate lyase